MAELIVYFSRAAENYVDGSLQWLETGNTARAAAIIHTLTKAPLFELEPVHPYADDYSTCTAQAKEDQRRKARPALRRLPDSLDGVDCIYLGYPNYWGTMPMAVFTFLEQFDFSGKTIRPFCTHEGSGLGSSVRDIRRLCPGAAVGDGLALYGSRIADARPAIAAWCAADTKEGQ